MEIGETGRRCDAGFRIDQGKAEVNKGCSRAFGGGGEGWRLGGSKSLSFAYASSRRTVRVY